MKKFTGLTLAETYEKLAELPPQTYVEMGPGLSIKVKDNGVPVMRIHYDAIEERNQALNPDWKRVEKAKYSVSGWDREQEINDQAGGGDKIFAALLSTFGEKIIIRDPFWYPQPEWDVVGGFDHGKTNATCLLKAYLDQSGNIYFCGEFYQMKTETWENQMWQNVDVMLRMPDLERMRWCRADPSIFYDTEAQEDGTFTNINAIYRGLGFKHLTSYPTSQSREDLTFEERMNAHWRDLGNNKPSVYIVCRNELDRRQPGLHPYDCPNLLWELKRWRRQELSSRQLLTRNPTEKIVDKDNHAIDPAKYITLSLPKPAAVPLLEKAKALVEGLNPMSAQIALTRFVNLGQGQTTAKQIDMRAKARMQR